MTAAAQRKKENVHATVSPWGGASLLDKHGALQRAVDAYNGCISTIVGAVSEFKRGLNTAQFEQRIQNTERELQRSRLEKRRIEMATVCVHYTTTRAHRDELEEEGKRLQRALLIEQTAFLNTYFAAINRVFTSLGSGRFAIAPEHSRRGNMPTVQLPCFLQRRACYSEQTAVLLQ